MDKKTENDALLQAKLNLETAQMAWKELERFFASGALIAVGRELDLVEVATRIAHDDKSTVEAWLAAGSLVKVSDAQAMHWHEKEAWLWTVVVKPWILVQDVGENAPNLH